MYPHLEIESPSGFLKTEIVVQPCVGEVTALDGKVIASIHQTIRQGNVVRELIRHIGFRLLVANILPFEREFMLPGTVVGDTQRVPFGKQIVPEEAAVDIGEPVRDVRQANLVVHALLLRISGPVLFVITGIDIVVGSPDIEPPRKGVTHRDIISFGLYMPMVLVDAVLRTTCLPSPRLM